MHEIDHTKLTDQTKFRLYEIKSIDNDFINEINQQKAYSKKLRRFVTIFDYIDKILIVQQLVLYQLFHLLVLLLVNQLEW